MRERYSPVHSPWRYRSSSIICKQVFRGVRRGLFGFEHPGESERHFVKRPTIESLEIDRGRLDMIVDLQGVSPVGCAGEGQARRFAVRSPMGSARQFSCVSALHKAFEGRDCPLNTVSSGSVGLALDAWTERGQHDCTPITRQPDEKRMNRAERCQKTRRYSS